MATLYAVVRVGDTIVFDGPTFEGWSFRRWIDEETAYVGVPPPAGITPKGMKVTPIHGPRQTFAKSVSKTATLDLFNGAVSYSTIQKYYAESNNNFCPNVKTPLLDVCFGYHADADQARTLEDVAYKTRGIFHTLLALEKNKRVLLQTCPKCNGTSPVIAAVR
jgi:hypothetical protein